MSEIGFLTYPVLLKGMGFSNTPIPFFLNPFKNNNHSSKIIMIH
jgi:hypothetical protein